MKKPKKSGKRAKQKGKKEDLPSEVKESVAAYFHSQDIMVWQGVPGGVNAITSIEYLNSKPIDYECFTILREISGLTDDTLADLLGLNVKTFRKYKAGDQSRIKIADQEHVINLLSLYKHGSEVFGSSEAFDEWLQKENYVFDNEKPLKYLKTISGIQFVDGQLTAMEYGDVV